MKIVKYIFILLTVSAALVGYIIVYPNFKYQRTKPLPIALPSPTGPIQLTSAFSLENAPSQSLKGSIATMSGEINWQGRVATQTAILTSPITIQQGEKLITKEKSNLSLDFPNGVNIQFSENTDIDIVQTIPANLVFSQNSGTSEYLKNGNYPVTVRTKGLLTEVDGDVLITYNEDKPLVSVFIKSGKALVAYNDSNYVSHEVDLPNGQIFVFNYDKRKVVSK